ncbi:MAG: hypothetical protein J5898_03630, partial [Lachnospiraceae bacterium]|nr:hypothetical protein [Lachnospiraceae bacterium]
EKPASTETPAVTEKPVKEPDKAKTEQDSEKKEKEPEKKKEETVLTSAGEFLCGGSRYAYARLSEAEQIWYRDMEKILGNMAEKGQLSDEGLKKGLGTEHIDHIFQCIMIDHPELFYVEGYVYNSYTYGGKLTSLEFSGSYSLSKEEALARKKQIEEQARQIVAGCPKGTDDYGKIRYVYETLILRTDYRLDAPDNQNIYSVFVGRKSVCQGYAKATQYLLNLLGVECTLVSGTVGSGTRHGWNLVRADGNYYYLDTTWGDASYQPAEGSGVIAGLDINYDYLCVTTEELLRTHTIDSEVAMPACTAIADNYYVREGLFFYEADEERLRNLFAQADASKSYIVSLKCASKQCYDQIFGMLIGESRIFEFYGIGAGSVAYIQSEQQYSLTFWVTNAS